MVFFDFAIQEYFESNKYILAFVNYSRKKNNISKKQLQKDNLISHATFRRAEVADFVSHPELLDTLANYFNIPTNYDPLLVQEINDEFNMFYTSLYFNKLEKMEEHFNNIEKKRGKMENSILISIYHFAKVICFLNSPRRVETEKIYESLQELEFFREDLLDVFKFLLDQYSYGYYSLLHNASEALKLVNKVYFLAKKFPRHLPLVLYQMSVNYYFINDYANSIFYMLEALPMLQDDLNYSRSISAQTNLAICFERLDNVVKSKEILSKLFLYLENNSLPRIEFLAKLTLANCYVTEKRYSKSIKLFEELEEDRVTKGESSLMILYCLYKLGLKEEFDILASKLHKERENNNFFYGYDDLIYLFESFFVRNKQNTINKLNVAKQTFNLYSDSKIIDLVNRELKAKKIIKTE